MSTLSIADPLPMHDEDTERTVLGAMLLSDSARNVVLDRLTAEHFYRPAHRAIFEATCDLVERGEPADPITVDDELGRRHERERVGGGSYLHSCMAACPTATNADYYVRIIANCAARRWLNETSSMIGTMASDPNVDVADLLEHVQSRITDATLAISHHDEDRSVGAFADQFFAELEYTQQHGPRQGVPTGYADLDNLLNGLKPGQLGIAGGRPGMGKSTLVTDVSREAAIRNDVPTLVISLELSEMELNQRIYAAEARVRLSSMQRKGGLADDDWRRLAASAGQMADAPLYVEEGANMTVAKIAAKARQYKRKHGLGLLVIDYLQLVTPTGGKATNREQEVAQMSRQLKLLAKELEIPVLIAAQVNRASASRADKRPQLSELRESGSLEADADVVILVDRPENHEGRDPDDFSRAGEVDLIVAKHRGGPTNVVLVAQQLHYCRFVNMVSGSSSLGDADASGQRGETNAPRVCPGCRDQVRGDHQDGWHPGCWQERQALMAE